MKKLLAMLLTLAMVTALCACGKPAEEIGIPVEALGELEEGASLVYWPMWAEAEPQGRVITKAVRAFTEATGVEVEIKWGGSRDTRRTLLPALEAGTVIDVFDEDLERVNGNWAEHLLDLGELYAASGLNGTINETLVALSRDLGGGTLKAVPYQPFVVAVMYQKNAFEAAGITGLPENKEEFYGVCDALKKAGYIPLTVDDVYLPLLFGYVVDRVAGAEAAAAIAAGDHEHPAVFAAAQVLEEMARAGYIDPRAAENIYPAGQRNVADGSAAMYLNGTWLPNEVRQKTPEGFRWGAFSLPALAPEGDGTEANSYGAQCLAINRDTRYPKAAFALIQWLTSGPFDQKLADSSMGVPMVKDAVWPAQTSDAEPILEGTTIRLPWAVGMEADTDLSEAIRANLAKLIVGELDAQGFAQALSGK